MNKPLLTLVPLLIVLLLLAACGGAAAPPPATSATAVAPLSAADAACALTAPNAEGPYYTPGSPVKSDFRPDSTGGETLRLTGRVLDEACRPLEGITIDFWQTDGDGSYDNAGYRLRGHQVSDASGDYALDTVLPGIYPGRPAHIHVKLFAADGRELLTTQIYFPGAGQVDGLFDPSLTARLEDGQGDPRAAGFDFVLAP